MSIKEIISTLDRLARGAWACSNDPRNPKKEQEKHERTAQALLEAIALLRTHPDAQPNEPLTEAQLKEMDGKAVFVIPKCQVSGYMGIVAAPEKSIICRGGFIPFSLCKEIYRRPPKEDER